MLNPYHEEIREIAILFAHSGAREERGNRAYAVAAAILRPDGPERKFSSLINYAHFTAMDRAAPIFRVRNWRRRRKPRRSLKNSRPSWVIPLLFSFCPNGTTSRL